MSIQNVLFDNPSSITGLQNNISNIYKLVPDYTQLPQGPIYLNGTGSVGFGFTDIGADLQSISATLTNGVKNCYNAYAVWSARNATGGIPVATDYLGSVIKAAANALPGGLTSTIPITGGDGTTWKRRLTLIRNDGCTIYDSNQDYGNTQGYGRISVGTSTSYVGTDYTQLQTSQPLRVPLLSNPMGISNVNLFGMGLEPSLASFCPTGVFGTDWTQNIGILEANVNAAVKGIGWAWRRNVFGSLNKTDGVSLVTNNRQNYFVDCAFNLATTEYQNSVIHYVIRLMYSQQS